MRFRCVALALLTAVAVAGCGGGARKTDETSPRATLYVSQDRRACDDARTKAARSARTPLCTIARALTLAAPGTRVLVAPGSYPPLTVNGPRRTGWVTVQAAEGGSVRIARIELARAAGWLAFAGLDLTGSALGPTFEVSEGSRHVRLVDSRVRSSRQDAILLRSGSGDVTIAGNRIHTAPLGNGVSFASTSTLPGSPPGASSEPPITRVTIRDNHFDGIAVDAMRPANFADLLVEGNDIEGLVERGQHSDVLQTLFGGRNLVFRDNYVHDNAAQGLFIKDGQVTNALVEGNVFVRNRRALAVQLSETVGLRLVNNTVWDNDFNVALREGVRDALVSNNIFQDMVVDDPRQAATEIRQDHNLIAGGWNWGARGRHDTTRPPTFVDPRRGDYRLSRRSAGIDAGTAAGAPARDKACRRRADDPAVRNTGAGDPPYVDLGALETSPRSTSADTAASGAACAP